MATVIQQEVASRSQGGETRPDREALSAVFKFAATHTARTATNALDESTIGMIMQLMRVT